MNDFWAELRDAVTTRAFLLVLGVLLLQWAFIASYLGAFHNPAPHDIRVAVVGPAQLADRLNQVPGHPVDARVVATEADARAQLERREVYGVFLPGKLLVAGAAGSAVAQALTAIAQQSGPVAVADVIPAAAGDARGLSGFYLVVGWVVGGYLVAAILGLSGGARPATRHRAVIRLGALAAYSLVSGLGGALIAETVLSALSGHFVALWALGALLVFAVGAFTMAMQVSLGLLGVGVAIILFVILGNPSAGGAYPSPLLPAFWRTIGPWLPPGAGTTAVRDIVYFPRASLTQPVLVLAAYALIGIAVTVLAAGHTPASTAAVQETAA